MSLPAEWKLPGSDPYKANVIVTGITTDATKRPSRVKSWVASLSSYG